MARLGFWLAVALCVAVGWSLAGQFLFEGDSMVAASLRACAPRSNDRCRDVNRLRDADGDEHVETLASVPPGAVVGRHVRKEKYTPLYRIDDRPTLALPGTAQTPALLPALLSLGIAIHRARRPDPA